MYTKSEKKTLTRFEAGSVLELLSVSIPLILSLASGAVMLIVDRIFLAHYSTDALNGAVSANMPIWTVQFAAVTLASIAQVFVGQYNGAGEHKKIGSAVWQMIWFSLGFAFLCQIFTLLGNQFLFLGNPVREEALRFFNWMMPFTFLAPLGMALSSFYMGRGKTLFVLAGTAVGNAVNLMLNYPLIFGVEGIVQPLGIEGAAIATILGMSAQALFLGLLFLSKHNRKTFGTDRWHFDAPLLRKGIAIGWPAALDRMINIAGWAVFVHVISTIGSVSLSVITITQSMMLFFSFMAQGIGRGVTSITANALGSRNASIINRTLVSSFKVNIALFLFYGLFFVCYPEPLIRCFLPDHIDTIGKEETFFMVLQCCQWLWVTTLIDAMRWVFIGLLTAVGDTRFIMWVGSTSIWFFAIVPACYTISQLGWPANSAWIFSTLYYGVICIAYAWRFQQGTWKNRLVIQDEPTAELNEELVPQEIQQEV